jgi:deoxyadenosine/deoxycytidine kinase
MTIISLEGNIGSGKDNFIQFFKKYFNENIYFLEDSVYNWEDETLLKNFYKNSERWAFTLEVQSTIQKIKNLQSIYNNLDKDKILITRRSPLSDKMCFVTSCKQMNYMTSKEVEIYNNLFETFNIPKYQGIIYLKSNVNKCYENIISKQTGIDKGINFDFIQKIHNNYQKWIQELKNENVLEIDIEKFRDLDGNEKIQEQLLQLILDKFPILTNHLKSLNKDEQKWTLVKKSQKKRNPKINAF